MPVGLLPGVRPIFVVKGDETEQGRQPNHRPEQAIGACGELHDGSEKQDQGSHACGGSHGSECRIEAEKDSQLAEGRDREADPADEPEFVKWGSVIALKMDKKDEQGQAGGRLKERDSLQALIGNHCQASQAFLREKTKMGRTRQEERSSRAAINS